ncbi:alpha/beta hydrolase-fold protein [Bowmanella denitrificans]|uniref:alpha/beta hydrolase-fold protein n=1 Tax=Bowmanella denitrificans TaxID=366582 RepID=UPI000C9BBAF9|nr:alpha/beta hydrolase-fold protein [Bowmanella denitrificans]
MYKLCPLFALLWAVLFSCWTHANTMLQDKISLTIESSHLKRSMRADIYLPLDYHLDADFIRYPVIYTLDTWTLADLVVGVTRHLGTTAAMPKSIVVAVHSDDGISISPQLYKSQSGLPGAADDKTFWGQDADAFHAYLAQELLPQVDQQVRSNDFRLLIGMSPTAAFAAHSLIKDPNLFDGHFLFAAASVVGMGYHPNSSLIDSLFEQLVKRPAHKGYLYVASATTDATEAPTQPDTLKTLSTRLAPFPAYQVRAEQITNFGHYPMVAQALLSALDLVFPRQDFDIGLNFNAFRENSEAGSMLKQIDNYYAYLSELVSFRVWPNADIPRNSDSLRAAAMMLRRAGRYDEALALGKRWVQLQPSSAKALAALAQTYQAAGQPNQAKPLLTKAISLAISSNDPLLTHYQQMAKQLGMVSEAHNADVASPPK